MSQIKFLNNQNQMKYQFSTTNHEIVLNDKIQQYTNENDFHSLRLTDFATTSMTISSRNNNANITRNDIHPLDSTHEVIYDHQIPEVDSVDDDYHIPSQCMIIPDVNGEVIIPSSLTSIPNLAFFQCANLVSVVFASPSLIISIGTASFYQCTNLRSISLPNSVTTIGDKAFMGAGALSINLSNSLVSIGNSAFYNSGVRPLIIPNSVVSIGDNAFMLCIQLTSIVFDEPSSLQTIGFKAFMNANIRSITFPMSLVKFSDSAFERALFETVTFSPSSVIKSFGGRFVFRGCDNLVTVSLPASLEVISNNAFEGKK
jgi:hypothetical protein